MHYEVISNFLICRLLNFFLKVNLSLICTIPVHLKLRLIDLDGRLIGRWREVRHNWPTTNIMSPSGGKLCIPLGQWWCCYWQLGVNNHTFVRRRELYTAQAVPHFGLMVFSIEICHRSVMAGVSSCSLKFVKIAIASMQLFIEICHILLLPAIYNELFTHFC